MTDLQELADGHLGEVARTLGLNRVLAMNFEDLRVKAGHVKSRWSGCAAGLDRVARGSGPCGRLATQLG